MTQFQARICFASALVIGALLVCGCCGCLNSGTTTGDAANIDDRLVGGWGTLGPMGDMVDSSGNYAGDVYSGEAYHFYRNGTFFYVIVGSGTIISGLVEQSGNYRVSGDQLYLYNVKENFYPFAGDQHKPERNAAEKDKTYTYSFENDGNKLVLLEQGFTVPDKYDRQ